MNIVLDLLLWIHLTSLGLGGAAVFGLPVVAGRMPTATAETRPVLFGIARRLSMLARAAVALLIITGPLLFWLKWDFTAPSMAWFSFKMLLVLALLAVVIFGGINAKRAENGDREAAQRMPRIGMASFAVFVALIFSAVFAFS